MFPRRSTQPSPRTELDLPQIKQYSHDFAVRQHEPLKGLQGAPVVPSVCSQWHDRATLWEVCSAAQEQVIDAHAGLVDWAVSCYEQTRDADLRNRLVDAGYGHRVTTVESYTFGRAFKKSIA